MNAAQKIVRQRCRATRRSGGLCSTLALPFIAFVSLSLGYGDAFAADVEEQKLKSAFLYNFTKFVEWPPGRFGGIDEPIVIGLVADDSMVSELAAIAANRQVDGRSLVVRRIDSVADLHASHVVFFSAQSRAQYAALRKAVEPKALVVTDAQPCGPDDGSICFVQQGGKLRFEINTDTAERAQLKISSQLLKLALAVHKGH